MLQSFSGRFGRFILGDTPPSPMQEVEREQATVSARGQAASSTSAGMGEQQLPQPTDGLMSKYPSPVYQGVPVAKRPPHQQIRCMTCNQTLEDEQPMVKCHVCTSWIHDTCVETLKIGSTWNADMCLCCQQTTTRQFKVISAQEVKKACLLYTSPSPRDS